MTKLIKVEEFIDSIKTYMLKMALTQRPVLIFLEKEQITTFFVKLEKSSLAAKRKKENSWTKSLSSSLIE